MRRHVFPQSASETARAGALVAVVAVLVAMVAALLGYNYAQASYRAVGTVTLTEIAGNRPAYELNTFSADFESALRSPEVRQAVRRSVPEGSTVTPIEVSRLTDASRVNLSLAAESAPLAEQALLAAGRTAYSQVVAQQRRLLQVQASVARSRLDALTQGINRQQIAILAAPEDEQAAQEFLLDQQRQAAGIAVADLASAQVSLAVAEQVDNTLATSGVVSVGEVYATSVLPQVLRVTVAGLLGGALAGLLLAFAARGRRASRPPKPQQAPSTSVTASGTTGSGTTGSGRAASSADGDESALLTPARRWGAGGLFDAGGELGPRAQVRWGREAAHVQPDLGDDRLWRLRQDLRVTLAGDELVHHRPPGDAEDGYDRQLDQSVLQELLDPVLLPAPLGDQRDPVAGQVPQPADRCRRHEAQPDHLPQPQTGWPVSGWRQRV